MTTTGCETFDRWCALNGQSALPAAPVTVAKFVADIAATGIEKIWPMIGEISRAHYLIGLADPTLGGGVSAALNDVAKIEPPRSWPKEQKFRFAQLPYDLQLYVAAHSAERETVVRRALNDAAEAKAALKKILEQTKAKTDGTKQDAA